MKTSFDIQVNILETLISTLDEIENDDSIFQNFHRIKEYLVNKNNGLKSKLHILENRVKEAERRLSNANLALHIAQSKASQFSDGNMHKLNVHQEERRVASSQAGLNVANKNIQVYEEAVNYVNSMIVSYMESFKIYEGNFKIYIPELKKYFIQLKELMEQYTN